MSVTAADAYVFAEDIRLVVWDLDETFWRGTLTEGGATVVAEHVAIVRTLAARGVMNSICSKNDLAPVRDLLAAHDVWDLFVFPDLSWAAKGPRVAALVAQMQLRPASVLFIDDNPTNLAEVARLAPGVNLADEGIIPALLANPRLAGKPDAGLTRLKQYKQMEQRHGAQQATSADPSAFLRDSRIVVSFDYDVAAHMPRVVELINRTNQLNFIKNRVSEDPSVAAQTLQPFFEQYSYQCALISVQDAYGDHGYCGFYIYESEHRRLLQFCFSCRILGLGIEQWVYEKLGRPEMDIVGEVLSDPNSPRHVDWINQAIKADSHVAVLPQAITARGGCELGALIHYFAATSDNAAGEYHFVRDGVYVRIDHTIILHQALAGLTPTQQAVAGRLGFEDDDFKTRIFDSFPGGHAVVLSFAVDVGAPMLRHKASGFIAPIFLSHVTWDTGRGVISPDAPPHTRAIAERVLGLMGDDFESLGPIDRTRFQAHVREMLDRIAPQTQVFILLAYEAEIEVDAKRVPAPIRSVLVNRWTRAVVRGRPNVHLLRMEDYAGPGDAFHNHFHFHRLTYHRLFVALHAALASGNFSALKRPQGLRVALQSAWVALRSARLLAPAKAALRRLTKR